ncbi:metallophosphoesterase [Opitutales bacterium]|nr:metallophosphoesterase [Opitutales bacterium]
MPKVMANFDIIGDVHGYPSLLIELLQILGYEENKGTFVHPLGRKIIFVGDLINRGPDTIEVLKIVQKLLSSEQAFAVLGNHEFRLIQQFIKDPTLVEPAIKPFIPWIQSLPLFLEFHELRVVHAAWHFASITKLKDQSVGDENFIRSTFDSQSDLGQAIDIILRGITVPIPNKLNYLDRFGIKRKKARIRWWEGEKNKINGSNFFPKSKKLLTESFAINSQKIGQEYLHNDKPIFLGHYCLPADEPKVINNVVCVDGCVTCDQVLWAYRFTSGEEISDVNLVQTSKA